MDDHSTMDEHEMTTTTMKKRGDYSAPPDDMVARRPPPGTTAMSTPPRMDDAGACLGEKSEQAQQRMEAGGSDCTTPFKDPLVLDPVKSLSFPAKLHAILSRRDYNDIVSWMPHGRSWRVHQPERFEMQVIPEFFVHCKYSSFIRQANGWGFRRVTKGPDRNSYYHEHFLRGRLHLCRHMRRSAPKDKSSTGGSRKPPDFYKMSEEDPLPEQCDEDGEIAKVSDSSEAATAAGMTVVTRRNMARRLSSLSNKARGTLDKTVGEDHHHKRQLALVSRPELRHGMGSDVTESKAAVETSKCSSTNGSPIERAARAIEDHQRQRRRSILAAEHAAAAVTAAATESRRRVAASMGVDPFPVEAAAASQVRMAKAAVTATSSSNSSNTVRGIYDPLLQRPSVLSRLSSLDAASSAAPGSLGAAPPTDHQPDTSYGRHLLETYSLSRRLSNAGAAGTAPPPPSSIHDTARAGVRALLGYHDTGTPLMSSGPPLPPATTPSVDHTTASLTLEAAAAAVAASGVLHRRPSLGRLDPTLLGLGGRGASAAAADRMDYLDLLRAGAAGAANGRYVNDRGNDGGLPPPLPLPRHWGERGDGRF